MPLRAPSPFLLPHQVRTFTSSAPLCAKSTKARLRDDHKDVPRYPFGPSQWYKQSNHGLYGGARIQFGNNVSEETETKTRRRWRPNIQPKQLFSLALQRKIRVRISTRVLRTIDKVGGLDEYLLGEKTGRIKELGMGGWLLRWRIMQTPMVKKRFAKQREELGLPRETLFEEQLKGMGGGKVSQEQLAQEIKKYDAQLDKQGSVALSEGEQEEIVDEEEVQDLASARRVMKRKAGGEAAKVVA